MDGGLEDASLCPQLPEQSHIRQSHMAGNISTTASGILVQKVIRYRYRVGQTENFVSFLSSSYRKELITWKCSGWHKQINIGFEEWDSNTSMSHKFRIFRWALPCVHKFSFCWDPCCLGHSDRFRGPRAICVRRIILIRERVIWKEKNNCGLLSEGRKVSQKINWKKIAFCVQGN